MTSIAPPSSNDGILGANLLCMASMVVWAAALPAAGFLIGRIPPLEITGLRMGLAGLFLLPIWWAMEGGRVIARANWLRGIAIGSLFAFGALMLIVSQALTDAVTVAIAAALLPLIGMTLEVMFDGRRVTMALVLGITLSFLGGVLAYTARLDEFGIGLGALAALASNLAYAVASRLAVKSLPAMTPLGRSAITLSGAGIVAGLVAFAHTAVTFGAGWGEFGLQQVAALGMFSIGGMAIAQLLWLASIGRLGIGVSSMHINAAAFYVMIFAWALGGAWNWVQVAGAVIVAIGVLVAQGIIPCYWPRNVAR